MRFTKGYVFTFIAAFSLLSANAMAGPMTSNPGQGPQAIQGMQGFKNKPLGNLFAKTFTKSSKNKLNNKKNRLPGLKTKLKPLKAYPKNHKPKHRKPKVSVPAPSMILIALGLFGLGMMRRRTS